MKSPSRKTKDPRLNLRARVAQKQVLQEAARLKHTTVNEFALQKACEAAQEVLAEETRNRLSKADRDAFRRALDAPPRRIPALRRLLTAPGVFDG